MALLKVSPLYVATAVKGVIQLFSRLSNECVKFQHVFKNENVEAAEAVDFIAFSPNFSYFLALYSDKTLTVWKMESDKKSWKKVNDLALNRRSTSAAFSVNESTIYVADKSGDLYSICVETFAHSEMKEEMKSILGHVSILLDVSVSDKYIITADRDEKIRITWKDRPHSIHCFCLGHTDFVCKLQLFNKNCLLSTSGDGTLRLWDLDQGTQICKCNVNNEINAGVELLPIAGTEGFNKQSVPALLTHANFFNLIAVGNVGLRNNVINIYELESVQINVKHCYQITLPDNQCLVDISFDTDEQQQSAMLYALLQTEQNVVITVFSCSTCSYETVSNEQLNYINSVLGEVSIKNACQLSYLQFFKTTIPGTVYEAFYKKKKNQFEKTNQVKKLKSDDDFEQNKPC